MRLLQNVCICLCVLRMHKLLKKKRWKIFLIKYGHAIELKIKLKTFWSLLGISNNVIFIYFPKAIYWRKEQLLYTHTHTHTQILSNTIFIKKSFTYFNYLGLAYTLVCNKMYIVCILTLGFILSLLVIFLVRLAASLLWPNPIL